MNKVFLLIIFTFAVLIIPFFTLSFNGQSPFSSVKMEIVLSPDGTSQKMEAKFIIEGREFSPSVQNFKVEGSNVSFSTVIEGTQVNFTGQLADSKLSGTLEAVEKGTRIASGTWSLAKSETTNSFVGKWTGTFSAQLVPQQQADPNFDARVEQPAYTKNRPKVLFDEAHNNFHTASGLYKPFVDLITNDGYTVMSNKEKFQQSILRGYDILVIVNAAGPRGQRASPAFTDEECDAVREWVRKGGSLMFIADHAPMGAAAEILAKRFGVDMSKGYTDDPSSTDKVLGDILFSRENKLLAEHSITSGRNRREHISRVVTFTGQSLKGPKESVEFLKLPDTAFDTLPPNKTTISAAGRTQGLAMKFGKGRVIVLGEAGILSAQIDNKGRMFGMNYPNTDNRQLALNIMHWLSRLLN